MKVLIVDDNEDITSLLSTFLKSKGFKGINPEYERMINLEK